MVEGPVEDGRGGRPLRVECGHHGVGLPMPTRRVIAQSDAARTAAVPPQQIGGDPAFIEEEIVARVSQVLTVAPASAVRGDVRSALFVSVQRFF